MKFKLVYFVLSLIIINACICAEIKPEETAVNGSEKVKPVGKEIEPQEATINNFRMVEHIEKEIHLQETAVDDFKKVKPMEKEIDILESVGEEFKKVIPTKKEIIIPGSTVEESEEVKPIEEETEIPDGAPEEFRGMEPVGKETETTATTAMTVEELEKTKHVDKEIEMPESAAAELEEVKPLEKEIERQESSVNEFEKEKFVEKEIETTETKMDESREVKPIEREIEIAERVMKEYEEVKPVQKEIEWPETAEEKFKETKLVEKGMEPKETAMNGFRNEKSVGTETTVESSEEMKVVEKEVEKSEGVTEEIKRVKLTEKDIKPHKNSVNEFKEEKFVEKQIETTETKMEGYREVKPDEKETELAERTVDEESDRVKHVKKELELRETTVHESKIEESVDKKIQTPEATVEESQEMKPVEKEIEVPKSEEKKSEGVKYVEKENEQQETSVNEFKIEKPEDKGIEMPESTVKEFKMVDEKEIKMSGSAVEESKEVKAIEKESRISETVVNESKEVKSKEKETKKKEKVADENLTGGFINFFRKLVLSENKAANEGQALYDKGNYRHALTLFSIAIEKDKNCPSNYVSRAKCYLQLGKQAKAISDFEKVMKRDGSTSTEHQCLVIKAALDFDNFHDIVKELDSINACGFVQVAYEMCSQKKFERALRSYTEAFLKEEYREYYLSRANCYVEMGKFDEAKSDLKRAKTVQSCYDSPSRRIPVPAKELGLTEERILFLDAWLDSELSIEDLEGKLSLSAEEVAKEGLAFCDKQKYHTAFLLFDTALEKNKSASNYVARGKCYGKMRKLEKAISDFEQAMHCNDDDDVSVAPRNQDLVIEAIVDLEEFDQFIRKLPSLLTFKLVQKAYIECSKKQFERALRLYDGAIFKEKCEEHYLARAICYVKMGKLDEARLDWNLGERYTSLYGGLLIITQQFRKSFGLRKEHEKIVKNLLKSDVHNADLEGKFLFSHSDFAQVANELFAAKRFTDAIYFYNAVIEIKPLPEYFQKRGDCYKKLGQIRKAHRDYEKADIMGKLNNTLSTDLSVTIISREELESDNEETSSENQETVTAGEETSAKEDKETGTEDTGVVIKNNEKETLKEDAK